MKKRIFLLFGLLCFTFFGFAQSDIKSRIDTLLNSESMRDSYTAVSIFDLTDGVEVYSHDANKLLRPASILKLLTTITAADYIGGDAKCMKTVVYTYGKVVNGVLDGDIYVKGGFDSEFMDEDMDRLVNLVAAKGIKKIKGNVVGDVSMADSLYWGAGWCWDDTPSSFQPYMSPLMFEKGRVKVQVSPLGSGKSVSVLPVSSFYKIKDLRRTPPYDRARAGVTRDWMNNRNEIIVKGNVKYPYTKELNMYRSQDFFMHTFVERLQKKGVDAYGYCFGKTPKSAVEIGAVEHTLQCALKEALKESDNLSADAILFQLGKEFNQDYLDRDDCLKVVRRKIEELGLNPTDYKLVDGCGVSLYNYVSARLMMEFLKFAYYDEGVRSDIFPNLPVAGRDGTLKHRLLKTDAAGRVHAKTGTVSGVSSLAGYVDSKSGHKFAFVIISNGIIPIRRGHQFQDAVCKMLVDYKPATSVTATE